MSEPGIRELLLSWCGGALGGLKHGFQLSFFRF